MRVSKRPQIDILHQYMLRKSQVLEKINLIKGAKRLSYEIKLQLILRCEKEIEDINFIIADLSCLRNAKIIKHHYTSMTENGNFSSQKMWKLKQKLNMKFSETPIAKLDKFGNLITTKQSLLSLYKEEYETRLSSTAPHQGYESLQQMKDYLFKLRVDLASQNTSEDWTLDDLVKVCNSLKNNKARDNNSFIYELFKPGKCLPNVLNLLLKMYNLIKSSLEIPFFLKDM